jgi:hypothetical protein
MGTVLFSGIISDITQDIIGCDIGWDVDENYEYCLLVPFLGSSPPPNVLIFINVPLITHLNLAERMRKL